jgi:hypothetical protein
VIRSSATSARPLAQRSSRRRSSEPSSPLARTCVRLWYSRCRAWKAWGRYPQPPGRPLPAENRVGCISLCLWPFYDLAHEPRRHGLPPVRVVPPGHSGGPVTKPTHVAVQRGIPASDQLVGYLNRSPISSPLIRRRGLAFDQPIQAVFGPGPATRGFSTGQLPSTTGASLGGHARASRDDRPTVACRRQVS